MEDSASDSNSNDIDGVVGSDHKVAVEPAVVSLALPSSTLPQAKESSNAATPVLSTSAAAEQPQQIPAPLLVEVELQQPEAEAGSSLSNVDEPLIKTGIFGTTSNIVNSIVGAGVVGIPYAFKESGLIVGLALLILVGMMTEKSLRMLVETASYNPNIGSLGVSTFEDLMSIPYGNVGANFISFSMFIIAYGAMVAYLLIIKDTIPIIMGTSASAEGSFLEREFIMFLASFFIILPLSLLRDMASLSFTSLISVLADIVLVGFVCFFAPIKESITAAGGITVVLSESIVTSKIFIGLGILSLAMCCQHSAFLVSGSLSNKTASRWSIVTASGLTISTILCILMGTAGYLGFLDKTKGDILNNFPADSYESNFARMLLATTMFFTYPMESFVARHVLAKFIYGGCMDDIITHPNTLEIAEIPKSCFGFLGRREKLTLGIYIAVLIPAFLLNDVGPVLSVCGALGGSCVAYIGPGLVYLGINGEMFLNHISDKLRNKKAGKASDSPASTGEIELPIAGNASATMERNDNDNININDIKNTTKITKTRISELDKPWWWWVGLYPLWVAIASTGSVGTKNKLEEIDREHFPGTVDMQAGADGIALSMITPCIVDCYIAISFIIFGVIAVFVGLLTNIYVQLNGSDQG